MIRWVGRAIAAWAKPRADLIVENLCLRQQLIVLQRRAPHPRLRDGDRRFGILVCRWFPTWTRPGNTTASSASGSTAVGHGTPRAGAPWIVLLETLPAATSRGILGP
jgi:hypothetical protein